ncbi:LacI family transcriptional regulator [Bacillus sp. V3-13]|uniref:LacI family DNA-binding transcriptional regulator n=1 Tax=Bacillus sp. V3-13 TaxID=2053728 RepID=UPI000C76891E|nr:substrate-binding domain-containing protein [Bacillus sp. V3-13]PLR76774.1 LacI family transcriptional regulator [Bacillus sp. V3-13]
MKRVTMADVAKHANVSKSTVSQFLNKRYDYMAELTKERIEQSIRELGYHPNVVARSLKQKKTSTIGVIIANILHTFSTQVIRAIEDVCHENDYHVIVCNADDNPEKEKKYFEMLIAKQVDGLIVFPTAKNLELYESILAQRFPLVFMDRLVHDIPVDTVMLNNQVASEKAVQHFIEKGYERISIVTNSLIQHITPRIERINGYRKAMKEADIPIREEYIKALEVDKIKDGLKEMFSLPNPPEAILAGNDFVLMEILNYVKEEQLLIPSDLALIGIDNVRFANFYSPPITTVKQPAFDMGKKAAELLFSKIESVNIDRKPEIYRFEPELIIRESC